MTTLLDQRVNYFDQWDSPDQIIHIHKKWYLDVRDDFGDLIHLCDDEGFLLYGPGRKKFEGYEHCGKCRRRPSPQVEMLARLHWRFFYAKK